jgi:hypothetical protein
MDLKNARLCLDCEGIFEDESRCPRCASEFWFPIMGWLRPMSEAERRKVVRLKDVRLLSKRSEKVLRTGTAL